MTARADGKKDRLFVEHARNFAVSFATTASKEAKPVGIPVKYLSV